MKTIHLVRSVKGGSGKTAFALRKVVDLVTSDEEKPIDLVTDDQKKATNPGTDNKKKVLYIDADVHASETMEMLYKKICKGNLDEDAKLGKPVRLFKFKKIELDENGKLKPPKHSLNTYIHPYRGFYSKLHEIILKADLYKAFTVSKEKREDLISSSTGGTGYPTATSSMNADYASNDLTNLQLTQKSVDFILCDPSKEGRSVFGSLFQSAGQSAVGIGAYLAKIRNLLSYIIDSNYDDVVVDMPPGSDSFSENLADMIINFVTKNAKDCELEIYYVSNDDIHHMISAAKAAIEHLHVMRSSSPIKVSFVYNQGRDSSSEENPYADRKSIISESGAHGRKGLADLFENSLCSKKENVEFELKRLNYYVFFRDDVYFNCLRHNEVVCFSLNNNKKAGLNDEKFSFIKPLE